MLKNLGYYGTYRNQDISVSVLLENPLGYGIDPSKLVFSVMVKNKRQGAKPRSFESCTFYIMDEQNRIYNTDKPACAQSDAKAEEAEDEAARCPDGLILADFKPEFLFQNLRIVFFDEPGQQLHIIVLKH